MSLDGESTAIVYDDATHTFRAANDNSTTKVEDLTGATNGTKNGEYFRVTQNGTQYYFGLNHLPGWATGKEETKSAWTVPIFKAHAGVSACPDGSFADTACTLGYRFNLDYVVDPRGNAIAYYYDTETGYYGAVDAEYGASVNLPELRTKDRIRNKDSDPALPNSEPDSDRKELDAIKKKYGTNPEICTRYDLCMVWCFAGDAAPCLQSMVPTWNARHHGTWMATMVANGVSPEDARLIGIAHELDGVKTGAPQWGSRDSRIDNYNNSVGIKIGMNVRVNELVRATF